MESEKFEEVRHFSHEYPLVFIDAEQSDLSKEAVCCACLESLLGRPSFGCGECEFYLHKKCAEAPSQISNSPFHSKHPTLQLKLSSISCDLCKEGRRMFKYVCTLCSASFDMKCALVLHNMNEDFRELKYVGHEHPLIFFENLKDDVKGVDCHWCQKPVVDSVYVCANCRFYLHKQCARLPTQLSHPCHRKHILYPEDANLVCSVCQKWHWSLFYCCLPCQFNIDIECVGSNPRSFIGCQKHSFTPFFREEFVCDACGTMGNYVLYICSACHVMIHKECILLPRIIKITRHHHNIIHNYFFQKKDLERHDCGICLGEVKVENGNYMCSKENCDFVAHVDCALEKKMYVVIDHLNDEDESSATNSSICVIEMNQRGEATKVKHFLHEHDLTLGNNIKEEDAKHCDACMLSISTSFYYCSKCDFLLHQTCAELPKKKQLWFYEPLATLNYSEDIFKCAQCDRLCSGFVYKGLENYFCLRCATTSHTLKCPGHEHSLFFDFKFKGKCSGCGFTCESGAYRCRDCNTFTLDFACITLPQATRYKYDKHLLSLTFHEESDDPEQYYCDLCEKKRDPNLWFYHCVSCNNSVHPRCVLEKYLFMKIKIGITFPYDHHPHIHNLISIKGRYETCYRCGGPCQDVALGCTTCEDNYTIHYDCWDRHTHRAC